MFDYYTDVDILVNGKPIKKFAHNGKLFIQSNHQTEYSIRIRNKGWGRRLFVVSVDGINVIDGTAAGSSKMGYVINGYESYEIKGFRTDSNTENQFKFSSKKRSYAAKSNETGGDTSNCGVIGIQVYDEYRPPVVMRSVFPTLGKLTSQIFDLNSDLGPERGMNVSYSYSRSANSIGQTKSTVSNFCQTEEPKANFDMGTEFSEKEVYSPVSEVDFKTGDLLTSVNIFYASREALIEMGVPVIRETKIPIFPNAFPSRFCKPPHR